MTLALLLVTLAVQPDPTETQVYNVESLTRAPQDWPGVRLGLPSTDEPLAAESAATAIFDAEELVELIKNNVAEDTWADSAVSIQLESGVITVVNRRSIQKKIGEYLAYWRSIAGRRIVLDAAFVKIDADLLAKIRVGADRPMALSADAVRQILEAAREGKQAELVTQMRVTAHNGQRVSVLDATHHTYVRDHDVQIATASVMLDPVPDVLVVGTQVDVRPTVEPSGSVTLELRTVTAEIDSMDERVLKLRALLGSAMMVDDERGPDKPGEFQPPTQKPSSQPRMAPIPVEAHISHPKVAVHSAGTTLTVRDRETAIASAAPSKGRLLVVLVTPSVVSADEKPAPEPAFDEQRLLRYYDISPLTRGLTDLAGPSLQPPTPSGGSTPLTGATFSLEEAGGMRLETSSVAQMIQKHIAPETWSNRRNFIQQTRRGNLLVRQKPEALAEIDAYLATIISARAYMITTEALVLAFRKGARADLAKDHPALAAGGYFLEPEKLAKILAQGGDRVRAVERAEVTGFPQQRVNVSRRLEESYIEDYEPQISTLAAMYDPVPGVLRTGFVLDVRPHFVAVPDRIELELRCWLTGREMKEQPEVVTGAGYLHMAKVSTQRWRTNVLCAKDRWSVAGIGSRRAGEEVEELVLLVRARANPPK